MRQWRLAAGLSQQTLAERCGVTRQAIHAVETGRYMPNTAVALRLGQALGCPVEALFAMPEHATHLEAHLVGGSKGAASTPVRVQVGRVGERLLAVPLHGDTATTTAADGLAILSGNPCSIELLINPDLVEHAVVVYGCDPAIPLLGAHLTRRYPQFRLICIQNNSLAALRSLARDEAHVAGAHLHDAATGEDNVPAVRRELAGRHVVVITLSQWQQGLIVADGNPKGIRHAVDLARPDVRVVNREPGAGSRQLLDAWLADSGVPSEQVQGYERLARSHLAVAEAVAMGLADAGPGILATARALDLDFLPLQEERYDLVVPAPYLSTPALQALFDVAVSSAFRRELAALGGYDTRATGTIVAELAA